MRSRPDGVLFLLLVLLLLLVLVRCGGSPGPTTLRAVPAGPSDSSPPPGAVNPVVTQANIATTICKRGWTATIRPPASYTSALKRQQIAARHLADTNPAHYEEDHSVPLEVAGAPRDPANLWPELRESAGAPKGYGVETKDRLENYIRAQVCSGAMSLAEGQGVFIGGNFFRWRDRILGLGVVP